MERIIKFKAKRLNNGEWIEGDLIHRGKGTYIYNPYINERGILIEQTEVDPSTVCQFTGLKDREGNDIYEHDLLTKDGTSAYKVGYANCGFTASYIEDDDFCLNLLAISKYCRVFENEFDRKEGE